MGNEKIRSEVDRFVSKHGRGREAVIPLLLEIQNKYHYLPGEALQRICDTTGITAAQLESVASFYSRFRFEPSGQHIISVCTGTACHVKGADIVYDSFRRELKLKENEVTDAVGIFTLEKVACLGCCTLAPVVKIGQLTYGHVKPGETSRILNDYLRKSKEAGGGTIPQVSDGSNLQGEIRLGLGSCCIASGSADVRKAVADVLMETGIRVGVRQVGCVGVCNQVPLLEIIRPGKPEVFYAKIRAGDVRDIILENFKHYDRLKRLKSNISRIFDHFLDDLSPKTFSLYEGDRRDTPLCEFLDPQINIATEKRGEINPCSLDDYLSSGGFTALGKVLKEMKPSEVIREIQRSELRGRGGAGFPTGEKWSIVAGQNGLKYVICNGDEGDPGAFMDRMLLESYPFRIIEGMLIAGYATGASEGIFYIRAEYPLAVLRISEALEICEKKGYTGSSVMGSSFSFKIRIFEGAGAFVCGEETALISSVEGKRGSPRLRPPYPAVCGLHGAPTLINNVETLSLVSWIFRNGAEKFSSIGTAGSKGTKVFALAGKVNRGGLIEVPMGITIREIVETIGYGIPGDKKFKAVQIGGPSGGCIPASMADLPVDFEALHSAGAMMGSGGLVVLDESDCMVDLAHYFLSFTRSQSCGKCTFCRLGTRRLLVILEKIRNGEGTSEDLELLEKLSRSVQAGSLCGLGRTAPNPVLTTLKYFREEYEAHLRGHCPAGKCIPLIRYDISEDCIGCTKCAQDCPSGAIEFKPYEIHKVDDAKCIRCDICRQVCPENAVLIKPVK